MKKRKLFVFLAATLMIVCAFAACGESETPATTADSLQEESCVETQVETTPAQTTSVVTGTLDETTTPETTPAPEWMAKLEENFFEKAVEEDGKYYIYLAYKFKSSSYAVRDNQTFVEAYVADRDDIMYANLEYGVMSEGIYLRATAEEIEAYAKNSYVTGIYSYPADKLIEGCKATRDVASSSDYASYLALAENKEKVLDRTQRPLVKIDTREELEAFRGTDAYKDYDEAFFAEKSLFMIHIPESTGSARHTLVHVIVDQGVTIVIDRASSWVGTDDAPTWVMLVEVEKSAIANQTSFEVIMHRAGY